MEDHDHDRDGRVTYREAVAMHEAMLREIRAEIRTLDATIDARLEQHYTRHDKDNEVHEGVHLREHDRHSGYMRWLATTVMTGLGVLLAIYAALGRG